MLGKGSGKSVAGGTILTSVGLYKSMGLTSYAQFGLRLGIGIWPMSPEVDKDGDGGI